MGKGEKNKVVSLRAAGGVLARSHGPVTKVLLIRRNGFWDLPKGKLEGAESHEECAVREVEEETGVKKPVIQSFLCQTYHEFTRDDVLYGKTTFWYSMEITEPNRPNPQVNEGITDTRWVEPMKAREMVHFDNLKIVLDKFINLLNKKRRDETSRL